MSYDLIEVSTQDGRPVELYEFQRNGEFFRFTSADVIVNDGTNDFTPIAIERSSIGQTDDFSKASINIEFMRDEDFANSFLRYSPDSPTTLTIKREHFGDGEFIVYWKGRVGGVSADGSRIKLECESVFSSLQRQGLRARYQRMCRHVLYDNNCTIDINQFSVPAIVTTITTNTIDYITVTDSANPELSLFYTMDSISGSTLTDETGTYDGTITGATEVEGFVLNGLQFNGTSDFVDTGFSLPATADFAISFPISSDDTDGAIFSNDNGQGGAFSVTIGASGFISVNFESMTLTSTTAVTLDGYESVYIDRSGSDWQLYVNSTLEDSGTEATAIDSGTMFIGKHADGTSFFSGIIDQFRVFDTIQIIENIKYIATENSNPTIASDYFLSGIVKDSVGVMRFVTAQSGQNITFSYPFESLLANDRIVLIPGCDHLNTTCSDKFNNLINYGGFPFFPTDNGPFSGRSVA